MSIYSITDEENDKMKIIVKPTYLQADLMFIRKSKDIEEEHAYLIMYDPFRKRLFLEEIKSKGSDNMYDAVVSGLKYFQENFDFIPTELQTDMGHEFTNKRVRNLIRISAVSNQIQDYQLLAPINSMCKYCRQALGTYAYDAKKLIHHYNFVKLCSYGVVPAMVSEEMLTPVVRILDLTIIGKKCELKLFKEKFGKERSSKWSRGLYKCVGIKYFHYCFIPVNYNPDLYDLCGNKKRNDTKKIKHIGIPMYYRRENEFRISNRTSPYVPNELEETSEYCIGGMLQDKGKWYIKTRSKVMEVHEANLMFNDCYDDRLNQIMPLIYVQVGRIKKDRFI